MRTQLNTVVRTAFCGGLVSWAALSVVRQLTPDGSVAMQQADPYGMWIPNYHFFAPEPAQHDLNLLYRDTLADGTVGPWQEVVLTERRRLRHMLFYSRRRLDKGMLDLTGEVIKIAQISGDDKGLSLSRPYIALLNMVTYCVTHDPNATQTQYSFVLSAAYEPTVEPHSTFVSHFHDLPADASRAAVVAHDAGALANA